MASIEDLVSLSGYSRSTVFRYLAGKEVRRAAADAIRAAVEETGYGVRRIGPVRVPEASFGINISVPPGFEGFKGYADAVQGIMGRASELGAPVGMNLSLQGLNPSGVIILGKGIREEDEERRELAAAGIPCVLVNRMIDEEGASWASADFRAAAADAVLRLAAGGCRRLACYCETENHRVEQQKVEGFLETAAEAGLFSEVYGPAQGSPEEALEAALSGPNPADGWFAPSDVAAMRIMRAARSRGLKLPQDLSVVGMNDVEEAPYFVPAVTSVHIPFRACGAAAVDALMRLLRNPLERSIKICLKHRMVERESCAPIIRP